MENSVEQPVLNFLSHGVDVTFAGREEKALIILADMTHLFTWNLEPENPARLLSPGVSF